MEPQQDFKELLGLFNDHGVDYLVVEAYALAFHGAPRNTGDIDLLIRPDKENAQRILRALDEFGFGSLGLKTEDFERPEMVVQLGVPPVRIDIITSISGVTWEEADSGRVAGHYGGIPVHYIGKTEYIRNKAASGRKKDLADIEALGEG